MLKPGQGAVAAWPARVGAPRRDRAATRSRRRVFNAAWLGGLRVTSHAAGATYTGTAPVGRDASLRDGQDLAFTDDTRYGVLVSVAAPRHGPLTVTLWSTPRWTVTSTHGAAARRTCRTPGRARRRRARPRQGRDGFDVTVTRSFARGGDVDHPSSYTVTYAPRAAVVCKARAPPPRVIRATALRPLGREPVQVAREQRDLADVRRLDQPADPALQPDREAAVRRDAAPERLDVRRVGRVGVAPLARARAT